MNPTAPIGVFDSGLGGFTVVREIQKRLPNENIVYFGDIARLPYGIKSKQQIVTFSKENTEFLLQHNIKALVIACNSSASAAGAHLRSHFRIPILDVILPAARSAVQATRKKRIGVIGTPATIRSQVYVKELQKIDPKVKVVTNACPLFVPLVEEGMMGTKIANSVVDYYLKPLRGKVDTLILGCTHYPLLKSDVQKYMGAKVSLIDSALPLVQDLEMLLQNLDLLNKVKKCGKLEVYVSDLPQNFIKIGEKFLGRKLHGVKVVRLKEEITVKERWMA